MIIIIVMVEDHEWGGKRSSNRRNSLLSFKPIGFLVPRLATLYCVFFVYGWLICSGVEDEVKRNKG